MKPKQSVEEVEIPDFSIEQNAYLQNPRVTAGMKSRKNLNNISPRPLTSINPTSVKSGYSIASRNELVSAHSSKQKLPAIPTKPNLVKKSPSRYAITQTMASPRVNPMRKSIKLGKNSMLT